MREIIHIVRFKFRSLLALSPEWGLANSIKHLSSFIVFGGFAFGSYLVAASATQYALETAHLGLFLLHRFLSMLLFVFFMSINVGNIIVSYATLYRSSEMHYYFTKPISHTTLFVVKFMDNFFYSSTAFFLLAMAVLMGYGSYFHMSWLFYVQTMVLMLIPFMFIAGCLAVMMLLFLMRFVDVVGVRTVIAGLVIGYLGSMYAYFTLTNPVKLVADVTAYYPRVDQYFADLDPAFVTFLPNHWIAESLYWTMRGDSSYALSYTIILILAALAMFFLMVLVARKIFYTSWLASLNLRLVGESRFPLLNIFLLSKPWRIDPQISVLLKKEFWQFIREPSQWIHLSIIAMLIVTFVASVAQIDLNQSLPLYQTISYMVMLLFNAFLIASIALRFVFPSISIEGVNFWKILSAPVNRSKLYWLKFLIPFVPVVLLSEVLVFTSHHSLLNHPTVILAASIIMFGISVALIGVNIGAGAFFSNFKEKNPIRVASSQSATLTFLVSIMYLAIIVSMIIIPFHKYFSFILRGVPFDVNGLIYTALAVLAISLTLGVVSLFIGLRSLRRDF